MHFIQSLIIASLPAVFAAALPPSSEEFSEIETRTLQGQCTIKVEQMNWEGIQIITLSDATKAHHTIHHPFTHKPYQHHHNQTHTRPYPEPIDHHHNHTHPHAEPHDHHHNHTHTHPHGETHPHHHNHTHPHPHHNGTLTGGTIQPQISTLGGPLSYGYSVTSTKGEEEVWFMYPAQTGPRFGTGPYGGCKIVKDWHAVPHNHEGHHEGHHHEGPKNGTHGTGAQEKCEVTHMERVFECGFAC